MSTDFITVSQAAQEKGCTGQALRNAIQRGDLNAVRPGPCSTLILRDDAYHAFQVQSTGGRAHARYKAKHTATSEA